MRDLAIIGLWHQGVVGSACMADLGYKVVGLDKDFERIQELNKGNAPLYEPGLDDLLKKGIDSKRLIFSSDFKEGLLGKKDIMIMFDTPVDDDDKSDLTELYEVVDEISTILEDNVVLYITAQVAVGTCFEIKQRITKKNPDLKFDIAYSPENLRLGKAIDLFNNPALPVIGAENPATYDRVCKLLEPLNADWRHVNLATSEMTKHALNAYLALSITFGNEIGNLCDEVGADGHKIAKLLKLEPRVGDQAMLLPGLGFSGATLARDVQTLRYLSKAKNLETLLLDGLWSSNTRQNDLVIRKIRKKHSTLKDLPIAVLGLTYKPDTSTLRRSASIEIIERMLEEEALVSCHDPKADPEELELFPNINSYDSLYEAIEGSKVLTLLTPWKDYYDLDFKLVKEIMSPDPIIIDTANIWDSENLENLGFIYLDIGKGSHSGESL
tara:strand:- start:3551 stop:4870 length:1320 start_codon:yes stop_codon:yes gene_type:complete